MPWTVTKNVAGVRCDSNANFQRSVCLTNDGSIGSDRTDHWTSVIASYHNRIDHRQFIFVGDETRWVHYAINIRQDAMMKFVHFRWNRDEIGCNQSDESYRCQWLHTVDGIDTVSTEACRQMCRCRKRNRAGRAPNLLFQRQFECKSYYRLHWLGIIVAKQLISGRRPNNGEALRAKFKLSNTFVRQIERKTAYTARLQRRTVGNHQIVLYIETIRRNTPETVGTICNDGHLRH